ncbi:DNA-directed RNA polymerase I subunit 1-like [Zingiber officinale]|uniref:DNA-directed RNA polymerase I subunit 1-like n=1 Tax=Zingiber officinale TaxID=94328 RepID=UPI001C4BDBD2|nr:DNA-directed RNA polymerase I subunit 1-like [Zingiber officinale]
MTDARNEEAASAVIDSVHFSFYTPEEVRRLSVKKITNEYLLDAKNSPIPDGLYDPAMGPLNDTDPCKSCGQLSVRCPGHCGHIDLAKPIYNPLLFKILQNLLQVTCFFCHKFRKNEDKVKHCVEQLRLIVKGDIAGARNLEAHSSSEAFFPQEESAESVTSVASDIEVASSEHKTWTSLQHSESRAVLYNFMSDKRKNCDNCGRKNPSITSPVFGWFNKGLRASDIKANILLGYNVGPTSSESKNSTVTHSRGESGSEMADEHSSLEQKTKEKIKLDDLPPEVIKLMQSSGPKHLLPSEVELILKDLWKNEADLCLLMLDLQCRSQSPMERGYEIFFLKAILVPPNKFRPAAASTARGVMEHPQNTLLNKVQQANIALKSCTGDSNNTDILRRWMDLQRSVNVLYDSTKGLGKSEKESNGIRQLLEKKSGILRQKMMGKRVNFACRSVISPDPYLAVNEIGIPPYFALRLTYPERVTPWNVKKLRLAVMNGADIHPGATHYKDRDRMYKLQASKDMRNVISRKLPTSRAVTAQHGMGPESDFEGKVVYRHLQDGDIVLVNRQPTLHKPSMMAHVVRVLKGEKTIRMHYANCSTYNADFDGDEMNVHLPQDEISRSEALNIANANKQYIVPTSGSPIRGLIQDHIVSAVLLTKLDTFLTREEYHQLIYVSCMPPTSYAQNRYGEKASLSWSENEIQPLPPAIWKPIPLWTGKQVITAILNYVTRGCLPFTIEKKGRIQKEYIGNDSAQLVLHIYNNELIHGMIDKAQFGTYGLVHAVHELYGPDVAGTLLSVFSRLFTSFLQMHGFTCGVDDLLLKRSSDMERDRILEKSEMLSEEVHRRFTRMKDDDKDPMKLQGEIEKVLRGHGESATALLDRMMSNAMNSLTSEINQTLFPSGLSKSFLTNCLSLMTATGAKGGLVNMTQISSLLGQQELEGKRVPRMVSGKTLPCFPPWDVSSRSGGFISDRFLTGLRPQEYYFHCMAGRDGLVDTAIKTSRSGYLQRCLVKNLECLKVSYDYTVRDADGSVVQFIYGEDGVDVLKSSYISEFKMLSDNQKVVLQKFNDQMVDATLEKSNIFINKLPSSLKEGATDFISKNQKRSPHQIKKKTFMKLMKQKYLTSLADPGESVGVIAAQSVGEPSTQMTLNTFHLAGKGDMNVTLGIPRLQEILMTASKDIRTPLMNCPLHAWKTKDDAERLSAKLRRVYVADVVEKMEVCTVPFSIYGNEIATIYKLKMTLYPSKLYPAFYELTLEDCMEVIRTTFVDAMEEAITKHLDMIHRISDINVASGKEENDFEEGFEEDESRNVATTAEANNDGGNGRDDDDDDDSDDDDGTGAKKSKQARDEVEYEDGIENEKFAATAGEHDDEIRSGFESGVDQIEEDEDYVMGGENPPDSDTDTEAPETPTKGHSTPMSVDSKKSKFTNKGEESLSKAESTTVSKDKKKKSKGKSEKLEVKKKLNKPKRSSKKIKRAISCKFEGLNFEVQFVFRKEPRILLAEIAQKTSKCVYVKQCKNIDKCTVKENKNNTDPFTLQIAGVDFATLWNLYEHLDVNQIYTNDVHAMLNTYGVEAARATIIKEVTNVFGLYGINVNIRHLSLIADFMTFHGGYRPMNRLGMAGFNTSPFGRMTFETATKFIVESALHGEVDTLESPSASVCLGQPVKYGTGCFDLMQNLPM